MKILNLNPPNTRVAFNDLKDNIFKRKPIKLLDRPTRWRKVAKIINLSPEGKDRLEWIIFYYYVSKKNVTYTCRYFGISRQCFYKWLNRFEKSLENVKTLETRSRAPKRTRDWEVTSKEETRVRRLRRKHMRWGKMKIRKLYIKIYKKKISSNKVQKVINRHNLYPDPIKKEKEDKRKKKRNRKKRIQELTKKAKVWFLLQLDGITIYREGLKRYILTAVDHNGKFGFARMYNSKSSKSAADFLYRLKYVIDAPLENLQTDNGSEFAGVFEKAVEKLDLEQYFSREYTPKDNPEVERFNGTLKNEWLRDGNLTMDTEKFNKRLTDWIIEYNWVRPHQTLDYQTPMEYIVENTKVSTKYSSSTKPLLFTNLCYIENTMHLLGWILAKQYQGGNVHE